MSVEGFVYIWRDNKRKKFYIGSHKGTTTDGYVCSNKRMMCAFRSRPETFTRRILESGFFLNDKELRTKEEKWLSLIDSEELGKKYYNEKKVASGGDIISTLSEERRRLHKERSLAARFRGLALWRKRNPDLISELAKRRRALVKNTYHPLPKFGKENHFFGRKHTDETKKIMSARAKSRPSNVAKIYLIEFPDGTTESHHGLPSIAMKYCKETKLKFSRFVDKGIPVNSNRKHNADNLLRGAYITTKTVP